MSNYKEKYQFMGYKDFKINTKLLKQTQMFICVI